MNPDDYTLATLNQYVCRLQGTESEAEKARLLAGLEDFGKVPSEPSVESKEQLAASMGVSAEDYTLQQLAFLKGMIEDDDCNISDPAAYAKAGERMSPETASAKAQIAALLGVEPTDYTLSELVAMKVDADM